MAFHAMHARGASGAWHAANARQHRDVFFITFIIQSVLQMHTTLLRIWVVLRKLNLALHLAVPCLPSSPRSHCKMVRNIVHSSFAARKILCANVRALIARENLQPNNVELIIQLIPMHRNYPIKNR